RLLPGFLRQTSMAARSKVDGAAVDARDILRAYSYLCKQNEGDNKAANRVLSLARSLADRGHWERAVVVVFFCFKSDSAFPNFNEIPSWCRWILSVVPYDQRERYMRVVCLLMALFKTSIMDRDAAAFYVMRTGGDIPDEYRSTRLLFQTALLGDLCSYGGPAAVDFFADGIVSASRNLKGEDRLNAMITGLISNHLHGPLETVDIQLKSLETYSAEIGLHASVVEAISEQVGLGILRGDSEYALAQALRALSYGPASRATFRKVALISNIIPLLQRPEHQALMPQIRIKLDELLNLPNLYLLLRRTVQAASLVCFPEKTEEVVAALKSDIDYQQEFYNVGGASRIGSELAVAGYCPLLNGRTPWILEGTVQYARRYVESRSTDRVRLSMLTASVIELSSQHREAETMALSARKRLSLAKVRHDLKYTLGYLRTAIEQFREHKNGAIDELLNAIASVLHVFSGHSIELTTTDIDAFIATHCLIAETLEGQRVVTSASEWGRSSPLPKNVSYDTLNSIVFNIVVNAYRHSPMGSEVRIQRQSSPSHLRLIIVNHCRESTEESAAPKPEPTDPVPQGRQHGIGLALIHTIARESGLLLTTNRTRELFTTVLEVPL
ncbi:MAG: ATP-binding protein, partial [Candidatus Kapabacteria bacterium]|nr:ATP-binding protein [Candidatus Kapabacteria bacterium]